MWHKCRLPGIATVLIVEVLILESSSLKQQMQRWSLLVRVRGASGGPVPPVALCAVTPSWTQQNSMVSSWDTGHSGFGKPIPWHFPFIKFLELKWKGENKSGCGPLPVFFHICFFLFVYNVVVIGRTRLQPYDSSPRHPPWPPFVFFLLTLKRHLQGLCRVYQAEVVTNEKLLRHGKGLVPLHVTMSHRATESPASSRFSKEKRKQNMMNIISKINHCSV